VTHAHYTPAVAVDGTSWTPWRVHFLRCLLLEKGQ